jgi:conjugal transfer ATP-binding protein TraC
MANVLNQIGQKISSFFGEPKFGFSPSSGEDDKQKESAFEGAAFSSLLLYESYDPESGLFHTETSAGFVVEAIPLVGVEESVLQEMVSLIQDVVQEGDSIQFLLWADPRISPYLNRWGQSREGREPIYRELAGKRIDYLQNAKEATARSFRLIISYSTPTGDVSVEQVSELCSIKDRILKILQAITFAYSWNADLFLTALRGMTNFQCSTRVEKVRWNPNEFLSHQVSIGGLVEVNSDSLSWHHSGSLKFRSYRAVDYPEEWSLSQVSSLIGDVLREGYRVHSPFWIQLGVHVPTQEKEQAAFKRRSTLIENQGKSRLLVRMIPQLADELAECDTVRRSVIKGSKFVWTQLSVGLWSTPKNLNRDDQALKSLFRINHFALAANDYVHLPCFLSQLPMSWSDYAKSLRRLGLLRTTLSSEVANFIPLEGEWAGTPSPGLLLLGRRGQLLNWSPFDNRSGNYNTIVVGRSGSGKSVFMQDLILSGLGTGANVFVLEVGRSFEKLCGCLGGQSVAFSSDSNIVLNPFTHVSKHDEEERLISFAMIKSIISCMASPSAKTSDYENALIEKAVVAAWEARKNQATISDVAKWLAQQEDSRAQSIAVMLTPYRAGGLYARYFEGANNTSFDRPMVLIELEELKSKPDLQAVVLQLFILSIANRAFTGDRKRPFYICIDEAWDLLRSPQTGPFIETLARRLRKYNGSLVVGTQSVEDFFETAGARAAFENSDWMCLLAQKKSSVASLAETKKIAMSEGMKSALESVTTRHGEYSEVMICDANGNYSIARLVLDPFSQLLYTTKADEYARIKDLQNSGLSVVEAISQILQERGLHGS